MKNKSASDMAEYIKKFKTAQLEAEPPWIAPWLSRARALRPQVCTSLVGGAHQLGA